jgi:hypothetical protein
MRRYVVFSVWGEEKANILTGGYIEIAANSLLAL